MYEYELEAIVEYTFRRHGATCPSYPSIVGAGFNSTILHYNTNQEQIHDGDLVLIDAGAEFNGFAGDITRTFPANGRFTRAQQAVYEAVLHANQEVIRLVRPGVSFMDLHQHSVRLLAEALVELGLLGGSPAEVIEKTRAEEAGGLKAQIASLMEASVATQGEARKLSAALRRGAGVQSGFGSAIASVGSTATVSPIVSAKLPFGVWAAMASASAPPSPKPRMMT